MCDDSLKSHRWGRLGGIKMKNTILEDDILN